MSLQIRRGTEAERLSITPLTAELIYTTDTQLVYVGDGVTAGGILVGSGGGNGNYGNANVVALLNSGLGGNIIPTVDNLYSLGDSTHQWKDLYVSNNTIYIDNVPLSANGGVLSFANVPLVAESGTSNITTSGNITGGNVILEPGGGITFPDGSTQTTSAQPYLDSDVGNYLASGTDSQNIITTANVSAAFFIGDGGFLSNVGGGGSYGNADVALYLPTYTGNLAGENVLLSGTTSTIEGAGTIAILPSIGNTVDLGTTRLLGDITPVNAMGGNVGTAGLPFFTGQFVNVLGDTITSTGEITGAHIIGEGGNLSNITGANVTGVVANATNAIFADNSGTAAFATTAGTASIATTASVAESVAGANVTGTVASATVAASANSVAAANVVGTVATATLAATVSTNAQPNITSVGTLTSLAMSGNINAGTHSINNLAEPVQGQDAATKAYVDSRSSGLSVKASVSAATTAPLGVTYTYDNGVDGVGAYILAATVGQLTIDGVAVTVGSRVLIKNEIGPYVDNLTPSAAFNGIYVVLDDGVANAFQLERTTDCDISTEIPAAYTLVTGGSTLANTGWVADVITPVVVGTTEINFDQFSAVTTYTGGDAIDVVGTVINALYDGTTITTNGLDQLTVGTVPGTSISGTVASAAVASVANSVAGANVSGQVANALVSGTVYESAQPNITSVGTLVDLTVTGNVTGDYFIGNGSQLTGLPAGYSNADVSTYLASGTDTAGIVTTGNVTANRIAATTFSGDGALITNITGGYVVGDVANAAYATLAGSAATVYDNAQPNITSVGTLVDLTSAGNITVQAGSFFIGDGGLLSNIAVGTDYSNANVANYLPTYTGDLANVNMANSLGVLMGTPTQGALVSNAVTLTTTTALTNGIALLNSVLGKLVPPSPPAFPASQTLSVTGLATYRMANSSQTDNVPGGGSTVAPGTTVSSVKRTAAYATNTITTAGPGDSGTVTALRNGVDAGSVALTGSSNGTYGNLIITNNQDYNLSNASIAAGFWSVFSSQLSGTVPAGWNSAQITDTAAGSTNTVKWYYDASSPGTPQFTSVTMTPPGSPTVIYSSTVPHYTNVNQFTIGYTVNRLSGDMYPTSDTFATGTAAGAFSAPVSVTYQTSSLGTNVLTANASATVSTTSTVISGFGSSAAAPTLTVVNSYATGTQALTTALGNTVLYKTGTSSTMEETNLVIGSPIGSGTGLAFRIVSPGATDTPVFTGTEAAFNSQTSTLETYDATIVAAILKHDVTNYSTGYLPAGPDLSVGRGAAQYFTFKFVRTATSKFDIRFSGTIAGMWIALPGSVIDAASTLNGWIDASVNYAGSGVPGASIPDGGNGSNGCGLGSTAPLNTLATNVSTTCTFGSVSSSSTTTNEIYVRIKLTAGQTVTALSLQTGSR